MAVLIWYYSCMVPCMCWCIPHWWATVPVILCSSHSNTGTVAHQWGIHQHIHGAEQELHKMCVCVCVHLRASVWPYKGSIVIVLLWSVIGGWIVTRNTLHSWLVGLSEMREAWTTQTYTIFILHKPVLYLWTVHCIIAISSVNCINTGIA
jgi:hypothetical protein